MLNTPTKNKDKALRSKGKSAPPSPRVTLSKLSHIRTELAKLYREARTGKIDTGKATKLTFMLQTLGRLIVDQELETRIAALELEAKHGKSGW